MTTDVLDGYYYGLSGIVTVLMQLSFFAIAYGCKFDLVTDFAGSTNFIILAVMSLLLGGNYGYRQIALTALLCFSRCWLAGFLLVRVCNRKKDARFDEVRGDFFKFLIFWIFQMVWAFTVSLPVVYVNSRNGSMDDKLEVADVIGWVLFVGAIGVQVTADVQKYQFRADPKNKGMFCSVGLWRWSRHPNYYGEIVMWWGAFIAAIPLIRQAHGSAAAAGWASILSPLFTMLILLFGTGLPTAEGTNLDRYYRNGHGKEWEAYADKTAPLVLMPNCLYHALPWFFKSAFCCEFDFLRYRKEFQVEESNT